MKYNNNIIDFFSKAKKYYQENKTLIILVVIFFIISLIFIIKWYTDTTRLELENQGFQTERKLTEEAIKQNEKNISLLKKEKEALFDTIAKYKSEKEDILEEKEKDRDIFNSDMEKIKSESVQQDQEWWDREGKRLIKKWGV